MATEELGAQMVVPVIRMHTEISPVQQNLDKSVGAIPASLDQRDDARNRRYMWQMA